MLRSSLLLHPAAFRTGKYRSEGQIIFLEISFRDDFRRLRMPRYLYTQPITHTFAVLGQGHSVLTFRCATHPTHLVGEKFSITTHSLPPDAKYVPTALLQYTPNDRGKINTGGSA